MSDPWDAIPGMDERDPAPTLEDEPAAVKLVLCEVGDRLFAVPGSQVAEILPPQPIYFVPGCPPALEGVLDVRGEIWSAIRLGDLVGVSHRGDSAPGSGVAPRGRDRSRLLLGRTAAMQSALRVDAVLDVLDCSPDGILAPPESLPDPLGAVASGVFAHGGRSVVLLDLERLFGSWLGAHP